MLYESPDPDNGAIAPLTRRLGVLRAELSSELSRPRPWTLPLRRQERALSWSSSIAIEGFGVGGDRVGNLTKGPSGASPGKEDEAALVCYAQAMEHVSVLASDPSFTWVDRVIYDLHFEACRFQKNEHPGLLRAGPIAVTSEDGGIAYRGPDGSELEPLMSELVASLQNSSGSDPAVAGAMAHLNLVSIHPFEDGNGRISRILQSLVLAREGNLAPEFGSIEPWLASHTDRHYAALRDAQGGRFDPYRDPTAWVIFCLQAHVDQANARLEKIEAAADRWHLLEELVSGRGWDDRLVIALEQALHGSTDRAGYVAEAGVANPTANLDLRRLLDAGLLEKQGAGRSTRYHATPRLKGAVIRD